MSYLLDHQTFLRILFSVGGLILFWSLALLFPFRRDPELREPKRWMNNLLFNVINGILMVIVVPLSLFELALNPQTVGGPILPIPFEGLALPIVIGVVLLDLGVYWQHRLFHKVGWLWRLHRVHHSDTSFDTTTAGRFHTLEIFLSFFIKGGLIVFFGLRPESVIIFEILLNFSALFNHSNFSLPASWERWVRPVFITPDLHRTHHSIKHDEMNRNFGFSITLWDMLFKTYRGSSSEDPQTMPIGLDHFRKKEEQTFVSLIKQPFKG